MKKKQIDTMEAFISTHAAPILLIQALSPARPFNLSVTALIKYVLFESIFLKQTIASFTMLIGSVYETPKFYIC